MTDSYAQFVGGIPENYDRWLGPHIFVDYAADIARRVAALNPAKVLEIAAGTGIVTRMLRDALPAAAWLTASDLNPPMLEQARQKFRSGESITFEPADAAALPYPDGVFDVVVCQFGVMFFPDKDRSYREVHRILAPGGRYVFNVWDSFEYNPFARIVHETVAGFFPTDPPGFYKVPFSYHSIDPIKRSLIEAGFDEITAAVVKVEKEIPKAADFARGLIYGNPLFEEIRSRASVQPDQVMSAVANELRHAFGADPGRMPLQAIVASGRKP